MVGRSERDAQESIHDGKKSSARQLHTIALQTCMVVCIL